MYLFSIYSLIVLYVTTVTVVIDNGCDNRKSRNMSVSNSHVSVEVFMRLNACFCGLVNGLLTMMFSAFLVVIVIHWACCFRVLDHRNACNLYRFG